MSLETGFAVWLTGLPKSGKSTLAEALTKEVLRRGRLVEVLDADAVGTALTNASDAEDVLTARLAFTAARLVRNGVPTLVATSSPVRANRDEAREQIGEFVEVFVSCPENVCKARGEQAGRTAASDRAYEASEDPEVTVETNLDTVEECVEKIVETLEMLQYLEPAQETYSEEQDAEVQKRLADLGYI